MGRGLGVGGKRMDRGGGTQFAILVVRQSGH